MVNITIDGKQIEVPEGTTVLNAARSAGIEIPTLCDHPELTPYGGCRLCLVEVEGARTLQPSCTLPVSNNMMVRTITEKTHEARRFILTMLFSERNHFCPYCQVSGGDCELQNAAYHEGMTHWPLQPNWKPYPVDASHPYIIIEHNRCILCRRCVRACGELVGNFTLGFEERGAESALIADLGVPLGESSCVGCGTCVQVCPTGSLIERWSAYQGREMEVERTKTMCIGCSIGCGIEVLTRDNRLVRIEGDWEVPVNKGVICDIGRFKPMVEERERINTPLVRKNGSLKAATWDEALGVIANITKEKNKAGFISTRLPIEAINVFHQLFTNLGAKITSLEEGHATAAVSKLAEEINTPFEAKIDAIHDADTVMVLGEDITVDHQVLSFFVKRLIPNGVKLINLDSGANGLDNFATINLKPKEKTELKVMDAIIAALKSNKFEKTDIKEVEEITGIQTDLFVEVINAFKSSKKPVILLGYKTSLTNYDEFITRAQDLAKLINAKLTTNKGGANSLAAAQFGLDKSVATEDIKFAYVALGDEQPTQQFAKRFEKVPFLVVQSSYVSTLTANAQVVLPVKNWLEDEGHYLNLEGRLQKAHKSLQASGEVRSNAEALLAVAEKAGIKINDDWKTKLSNRPTSVTIEM